MLQGPSVGLTLGLNIPLCYDLVTYEERKKEEKLEWVE